MVVRKVTDLRYGKPKTCRISKKYNVLEKLERNLLKLNETNGYNFS